MSTIQIDTVVSMHFTLTLDDGKRVDSSEGSEPLEYLHGHGNVVPGLEEEMTGRSVGDSFTVQVPAEHGYGEKDPEAIQNVPRSSFPDDLELNPGVKLVAEDEHGQAVPMTVVEVVGDEVTVDMNHPLAGKDLTFAIEVVGVRAATQEEIRHGHAHGPGGHNH